jgi:hypothetical protein
MVTQYIKARWPGLASLDWPPSWSDPTSNPGNWFHYSKTGN